MNICLLSVVMMISSFKVFNLMLNAPTETPLIKQSVFWLNSSVFIFNLSSFLLWAVQNYLLSKNINVEFTMNMFVPLNVIFYSMLGIALLVENKNIRPFGSGNS